MAARIVELRTKPKRLRAEQAERLRQAFLPFEDEIPEQAAREIRHVINRLTPSRNKWTFVMLSPEQNEAVVNWLVQHSSRPLVAVRLWALCFKDLDPDTGEIRHRREEMAASLGIGEEHVSRVMTELVRMGAITRRRERIGGLRGPGLVRYFMNPRVATHLPEGARDIAQAEAPLLTLLEGGKE
jgi:CRP-like cAMP-binding protein